MAAGADLVLTDSNVKAAQRWGGLADNHGAVEQAAVSLVGPDPSDYRLPLFPRSSTSAQTVALVSGVSSVRATGYGNPIGYTAEDQPINAFDHDPSTAWRVGAFSPVDGQGIGVQLAHPVTTDHLTLAQPTDRMANRFITRVTLRFDGGRATTADLGPASRSAGGQTVRFAPRTFSHLDIVIDANTRDGTKRYDDLSPVGFTEVTIPGVPAATESLRLPTDLLARAGAASAAHRLVVLVARQRAARVPRTDPEGSVSRTFTLPTPRAFSVSGTARMAVGDPGALVDRLVGAGGGAGVVGATGSSRLGGDLRARASAAVDGDPSTSWSAAIGPQAGQWVQYSLHRPTTFDHLTLQVVADGRHSIPT
ncbi:MAG: discoidin domain-containing protein, partial [Acidimicrobiales bacterium]